MALAPQFQKLLTGCQEMAFSHLRPLVDRMFENADIALLDFAEKAENNMAQSLFFDAMSEVRKRRSSIEQHFYAEVKRSFAQFPCKPDTKTQSLASESEPPGLSLVDTEEMETSVATLNAAGKLASRIMDKIFALKQRLSVVNGGDAVAENEIPGGPAWLGFAFQQSVEHLELENKVRLVFIALFDKYVLSKADTLFDEYNKRLIQHGILPNLRYEVRKQAGGVEIIEKSVPGQADEQTVQVCEPGADRQDDQTPSELGEELFGRICELMVGRRATSTPAGHAAAGNARSGGSGMAPSGAGGYAGAGNTGGGYTGGSNVGGGYAGGSSPNNAEAGAGEASAGGTGGGSPLVSQISNLQSQVQAGTAQLSSNEFIENIEIDETLINRLQNTLAEERDKIFGGIDRRKLPAADTNVIELVGMLFEYMLRDENLPNVVKALLSRLHTPLLKVAVVDRNFFTHTHHSARKLLNDMTAAGIRWVEEGQIERGIFPKMKEIVDRVLLEFKEDVTIFDTLQEEFTKAVNDLDHRAKLVEERTAEAATGQEKLQAARQRAQQEVRVLTQGQAVAASCLEFLQRIWADKLTFILLRNEQGEESKDWHSATSLARRMVDASLPPASEAQRSARQQSLDALQQELREATQSLQQADKEKLISRLFAAQKQVIEAQVQSHEKQPQAEPQPVIQEVAPEEPVEEQAEQSVSVSPEQQAMIEKLNSVSFGTWFEFAQPGQPRRRFKLSWRSTVTEKFMFVDQMGVKAAVISMHELADCILNGTVYIDNGDQKPFVDRALNAIHRMLDRAA